MPLPVLGRSGDGPDSMTVRTYDLALLDLSNQALGSSYEDQSGDQLLLVAKMVKIHDLRGKSLPTVSIRHIFQTLYELPVPCNPLLPSRREYLSMVGLVGRRGIPLAPRCIRAVSAVTLKSFPCLVAKVEVFDRF